MKFPVLLLLCTSFILFQGCSREETETFKTDSNGRLKIGLVFDIGGRGDKSFNDAAYAGLEKAKKELGIDFEVIDPGEGTDRESALRKLAVKKDIGLIFGVGFIFTEDITNVAGEFPDKKFACIDFSVTDPELIPENLVALEFREEEGSFLVGAIAGLVTETNKVGFIGGMESALIRKFERGFTRGVKHVNPGCEVMTGYISVTADGFKNPMKAQEIASSQYNRGADIIFHASGLSGIGLFEAAKNYNKLAIGVDLDQYNEAPGHVLTSMVKRVDEAIYQTINKYVNDNFQSGVFTFGLNENGVSFVYDDNNKEMISTGDMEKIMMIKEEIIKNGIPSY